MTNDWSRQLEALAYASGKPLARARIKAVPEDFRVTELMDVVPAGEGEHTWLWLEKRKRNTEQVARSLADFADVKRRDVGYSGLKDFQAVTKQWFSVWKPRGKDPDWANFELPGVVVRNITKHTKKIRRGTHRANQFEIRLTDFDDCNDSCAERLTTIMTKGVPNYFGPQRFGRQCDNMRLAEEMLLGGKKIKSRSLRSLVLSAARSWLFNSVVSRRIENDTWQHLYKGEPANLAGSNSVFNATGEEFQRLASMDIHPTAPLVGIGGEKTMAACAELFELERNWLDGYSTMTSALERTGLEYKRRPLRSTVSDLSWEIEPSFLRLRFSLPSGQYATSVLRELVTQPETDL